MLLISKYSFCFGAENFSLFIAFNRTFEFDRTKMVKLALSEEFAKFHLCQSPRLTQEMVAKLKATGVRKVYNCNI